MKIRENSKLKFRHPSLPAPAQLSSSDSYQPVVEKFWQRPSSFFDSAKVAGSIEPLPLFDTGKRRAAWQPAQALFLLSLARGPV